MNISPISFGKKIPIANCKVLDAKSKKSIEATFFEYDCKDHKDSLEVAYLGGKWAFRDALSTGMERKFRRYLRGKPQEPYRYYGIQTTNGQILGLCNTADYATHTDVEYIARDLSKNYKYVGQMMLAQIAKQTLVNDKRQLIIKNPTDDNYGFYEKGCGFEFCDEYGFDMQMERKKMAQFVMNIEDKTNCSIF